MYSRSFINNYFEFNSFAPNTGYVRHSQSDPYRWTLPIASIREVIYFVPYNKSYAKSPRTVVYNQNITLILSNDIYLNIISSILMSIMPLTRRE